MVHYGGIQNDGVENLIEQREDHRRRNSAPTRRTSDLTGQILENLFLRF